MRILLVEDEPDAARMLAKGFREQAYAIDVAADGDAALEMAYINSYDLLEYLARRAGEVATRSDIAEHVWDESFDPFSNLIEVYIQRLRRKIDDDHDIKLIRTRRGEGYMLTAGDEDRDY